MTHRLQTTFMFFGPNGNEMDPETVVDILDRTARSGLNPVLRWRGPCGGGLPELTVTGPHARIESWVRQVMFEHEQDDDPNMQPIIAAIEKVVP
jgi:hypothetical protein